MMKTHYLKVWTKQFDAVRRGAKTHEVRKGDKDYRAGDIIIMREFDPHSSEYTGKCLETQVTFITRGGTFGIPEDICVMSIRPVHAAIDFEEVVDRMPEERRPHFMRSGYKKRQQEQQQYSDDEVEVDVDDEDNDEDDNIGNN